MASLWAVRWLSFYLLIGLFHLRFTKAAWPLSNTPTIDLFGLFEDKFGASEGETTTISVHSAAMFRAAIILCQQYNITVDGKLIGWQIAQTGGTRIGALDNTCEGLRSSNIVGIVGPSVSREAPVIADLSQTIGIPTVSYGATNPQLSDKNAFPSFYRTVSSDNAAALAIVKLFFKYNWTSCVIIFQSDDFGIGGADAISQIFSSYDLTVSATLIFDIYTLKFRGNLKDTLRSSSSRIVLVWASSVYTSTILQYGLDDDVIGPEFLWILSSSVPLNVFNQSYYPQLVGMMTVEPTVGSKVGASINTTLLNAAYALWQQYEPETFPESNEVDNYALFAFDATWSLILSLQKLCSSSSNSSSPCLSFTNATSCYRRHLLDTDLFFNIISGTDFLGVSGPVQFNTTTTDRINGTYYIAQNLQYNLNRLTYAPVLQWTGSGDWELATKSSVIIWPGGSSTPPKDYPQLKGVTIRIGIVGPPPFTMMTDITDEFGNSTSKWVGYILDLLDYLQVNMKFKAQISLLTSNQTYDQMVQAVADNYYDILIGDVTITAKRREKVDFSNSIFDNSLRIITRQATSVSYDLLWFMKPFSPSVWLVIMGALLYASILICLLERPINDALKDKSYISAVAMSVWFTFGTLVGYGADFHVQTAAGRLLSVGLYILSIILVATYTANLASDLTVSKSQNIISGLDDIKSGQVPPNRVGIIVGSSIEDYYLKEISGGKLNYYPLYIESDIYSCLLNNTIDAAIMDIGVLQYATNMIYNNLTLVGPDFEPSAYGIVMPKSWIYGQILDINILALREKNVLDSLKQKWFGTSNLTVTTDSNGSTSITIQQVGGLFFIFGLISILSVLLFVWLHRSLMKKYLKKNIHKISRLFRQNDPVEIPPIQNSHEAPKHSVLDLYGPITTYL